MKGGVHFADVADGRDNNFDVLRLVAATLVLVSHAFALTNASEPLAAVGGPTLGGLGVAMFFGMSGMLIAKSWHWEPRLRPFLQKRALRILPGLWVATILTTLVLGALTTSLPASSYYSNWGTWSYLGRCLALITFDGTLPGVFVDNPYPSAVNGSLWTLPLEVTAYLILAGLGIAGALRRAPTVVMCAAMAASTLVLQGSMLEAVTNLFAYFLAGAALYLWRDRIWLSWPVAIALVALWIASFGSAVVVLTGVAALPYATLVASYRTPVTLRWFTGLGDVSYGMYIYAFPVQQAVMWLIPSAGPLLNIAISLPITWVLALASWRWVEQPALRLKPRSSRSAPIANAPVPDTASRSCPETLRSNPANS